VQQSRYPCISKLNRVWSEPPVFVSYGIALLSVTAAVVIAHLPDIYFVTAPVSLLLSAIMVSVWFGGVRPGLEPKDVEHLFDPFFTTRAEGM
jgi:signal transduction histidine kinase